MKLSGLIFLFLIFAVTLQLKGQSAEDEKLVLPKAEELIPQVKSVSSIDAWKE